MMKKAIIFFMFLITGLNAHATVQVPDLLLIGKDTIFLYSFPLENFLEHRPFGFTSDSLRSTNCWRGYQAIWRLVNDTLYLERIRRCESDKIQGDENIYALFEKNKLEGTFSKGKVVAYWYDKTLIQYLLPKGIPNYKNEIYLWEKKDKNKKNTILRLKFEKGVLKVNNLQKE
ncbi:hypothetical protein [Rufibacter roseus]|uniref:GLPGLI family protein n=1 Tax=Rufibacter roseus TaxID=1567108 RepID=A0ABW2DSC0_9BACT|nr:hypothetical protein [Rufibacter roseus]